MQTQPIMHQSPPTHDLGPDETLYFLHIHKTAGSSLRGYLYDYFAREETCRLPWELSAILERPREELRRFRCIAGHYGYYLEKIIGKPLVYMTMLRDPIERTISAFYDQRWREDLWLHEHIKDMTLEDYVFDAIGAREVMNFQTCSLAFDDVERDLYGHSELWRDPEQTRRVLGDRALLELAKSRLERFAFVGLQDRFEESQRLLAYTFGWPAPDRTPRENIRRKTSEELSARVLERIRELTALDQELYDFARERFDSCVASLSDEMIGARHRAAMGRRPRQDRVQIRFERGIVGSGWQDRETTAQWAGRWTGPGTTSSLHFPLTSGRAYTLFAQVGAFAPDIVRGLHIEVNGKELRLHTEPCPDKPNYTCIRAEISRQLVDRSPEFLELVLRVPRTIRPHDKNPASNDQRLLGLRMQALELMPGITNITLTEWARQVQTQMSEAAAAQTAGI